MLSIWVSIYFFKFNRHTVTSHVTHSLSTICCVTVIWRNRHICHNTTCVAVYQNYKCDKCVTDKQAFYHSISSYKSEIYAML